MLIRLLLSAILAASAALPAAAQLRSPAPVQASAFLEPVGPSASRWRAAGYGAGIGAALGAAAFLARSGGCWRRAESMCELAIPIYVGGGMAAGGLIGYLLGGRGEG